MASSTIKNTAIHQQIISISGIAVTKKGAHKMAYLCSKPIENHSALLDFLRGFDRNDILCVLPFQKGIIFKRYTYIVLYYRNDI